jgi:mannose-6-phosphate isomerase-like protein (cupin superfamily)
LRRNIVPAYNRSQSPTAIAPDGIQIRDLVNTPQGATKLSVAEGLLPAGQRSANVYHTIYEEIWYFLQGRGIFHLHAPGSASEERMLIAPGDAVLVPARHGFWAENTGDDDLIFLLCGSPPWGSGQVVVSWPPANVQPDPDRPNP